MKRIRINLIITLVALAVVALLVIQFFQMAEVYNRKSSQLHDKTVSLLEKTALSYDKANNLDRYLSISQKDFGQEYKDLLKEEFKNLLDINESIDIKDTNLVRNGKSEKYLIIKGNSLDSVSGLTAQHRVMARDVRDVSEVFRKESGIFPNNISYEMSEELDIRMMEQIFRKSKYISSLMMQMFRENTYESPEDRINLEILDSILTSEVKRSNLPNQFTFALLDDHLAPIDFEQKSKNYSAHFDTTNLIYTNLFPGNVLSEDIYLAINFDSKATFLMKEVLGVLIISLGLVIIIFITLAFMLRTIMKQKHLSELKNDFISNITHEFKTPISTISLACQALEDKDMTVGTNDESLPFVKMIVAENTRLSILVESVLQSSLMDRGELTLEIEENNISEIVRSISDVTARRIELLGGEFSVEMPAEDIQVKCDKVHTQQMILNLVDNAIKYSKDAPNVKIILKKENTGASLHVIDTGIGVEKEHLSKIFDKLYRVPTGNVHNVKGFGLGLSYVESIAKSQNWQVKVTSNTNIGSEFTLIMI